MCICAEVITSDNPLLVVEHSYHINKVLLGTEELDYHMLNYCR